MNSASSNHSKPKTVRNIKKIDLGAAALYAQEQAQKQENQFPGDLISVNNNNQTETKNADLLGDLFSGLSVSHGNDLSLISGASNNSGEEFADFSQFQPIEQSNIQQNDDFADFKSAFDTGSNATVATKSNTNDLLNSNFDIDGPTNPSDSFAAMNPFRSNAKPMEPQKPLDISLLTPIVANSSSSNTTLNTAEANRPSSSLKIGSIFNFKIEFFKLKFIFFSGDTWSGLKTNINFDNILDLKNSKPIAPTINELVQANNQQKIANQQQPLSFNIPKSKPPFIT